VTPLILDGAALAGARAPRLRERALAVEAFRGSAPRLLLLAFEGPDGRAPWVSGKLRACAAAGVEVRALGLRRDVDARQARTRLEDALADFPADGVFVQFPFPTGFDGDALSAAIPPGTDIDVMSPEGVRAFFEGGRPDPPLTIAAMLELLRANGVAVEGHSALVIGERTPFNRMLRASLVRRGAAATVVSAAAPELAGRLAGSTLVVTSAAEPGALRSRDLAPDAIVVDGGYFNPGAVGDVDTADGIEHLRAFAPVPGGLGPMTVSMLVEAVVGRAEGRDPAVG